MFSCAHLVVAVQLREMCNGRMACRAGQALILTKALGTGAILAAHMQLKAKGVWLQGGPCSALCGASRAQRDFQATSASSPSFRSQRMLLSMRLEADLRQNSM